MNIQFIYFFTISVIINQIFAATHETQILCLKLNNYLTATSANLNSNNNIHTLFCKQDNYRLFIAQVQYENDYDSYCYNKLINNNKTLSITPDQQQKDSGGDGSSKESSSFHDRKCLAHRKEKIAKECNGKPKCDVNLNEHEISFDEKHIDYKTCNFIAKRLIISYECINVDYTKSTRVIDICMPPNDISASDGYIVSPNYPQHYSARLFCTKKIKRNEMKNERIEIYLIKLNTEKQSLLTANPTDFLEVNKNAMYFGNREYEVIYNGTDDANLLFKTDNLFTKGGFLLYYKIIGHRKGSIISGSSKRPITKIIESTRLATTTVVLNTTRVIELKNTSNTIQELALEEKADSQSKLFNVVANSTVNIENHSIHGLLNTDLDTRNDNSKTVFMILTVIMCVLCAVLFVLLIVIRKRRKYKLNKNEVVYSGGSSSSADTRTTVTDRQSVFLDSSVIFTPYNDDSNAHLLLNTSANVSTVVRPVRMRASEPQSEVYEDITLLNNHEDKKLSIGNENHYIDDPTSNNYYCYIKVPDESTTTAIAIDTTVVPPSLPTSSPPSTASPSSQNSIKTPTSTRKFPMNLPASTPNGEFLPKTSDKVSIEDEDFSYYRVPLNNAPVNA